MPTQQPYVLFMSSIPGNQQKCVNSMFVGDKMWNQWRTEGGGFGGFKPPPKIPKIWQSRTGLQIEREMFSVPIPTS